MAENTPTDAQVEAAARAIYELHESTGYRSQPWDVMVASKDRANRHRVARDRAYARAALAAAAAVQPEVIDAAHIARQREFSLRTFGPGLRTDGVLDHIAKESVEVRAEPTDLGEWADIIILAFDGAHRTGADPQAIIDAIKGKQARNEARTWPDWRAAELGKAIEHDRTDEAAVQPERAPLPALTPRLRACVEQWSDCIEGDYHPSCCRFPKSCSCTVYDPERVTPEDLEPTDV